MKPKVHDLDKRQDEPEYVILGGTEIDISFIPAGVSIPLLGLYDKWVKEIREQGGVEAIEKDPEKAMANAEIMADMIAMFTSYIDERLTKDWILRNLMIDKVMFLMQLLVKTITKNLPKNGAKKKQNQLALKK